MEQSSDLWGTMYNNIQRFEIQCGDLPCREIKEGEIIFQLKICTNLGKDQLPNYQTMLYPTMLNKYSNFKVKCEGKK